MLDKEVFKRQMQRLKNIFPEWKARLGDKQVIKDWYNEFEDLSEERFVKKVDSFIESSSYRPTVAGILEQNKKKEDVIDGYTIAN